MQQDDQGSLTCFDVMQSHLVKVGIALPHIPGLNLSHVQPSIADSRTTEIYLGNPTPDVLKAAIEGFKAKVLVKG